MTEEKKRNMLRKVKSTSKNKYKSKGKKPLAGIFACIALILLLVVGNFNLGSTTNSFGSIEQVEERLFKQPLSIAEQELPKDLILPVPFFELTDEPVVEYQRVDGKVVNLHTEFEGKNFYMTLRLHEDRNLFNRHAESLRKSKGKEMEYLQKEKENQMMFVNYDGTEEIVYEHNGYFYRVSLYEKGDKQNSLLASTEKHLDLLREHLY